MNRPCDAACACFKDLDINPFTSGESVVCALLADLMGVLCKEAESLREARPDNGFHKFRSLLRRVLHLLEHLKTPPSKSVDSLKREMARLCALTATANALHEFVENERRHTSAMPEVLRPGLASVFKTLNSELTAERRKLSASPSVKTLPMLLERRKATFKHMSAALTTKEASLEASDNIVLLAKCSIGQSFQDLCSLGGMLKSGSPSEELERFRLICRRTRYTLEAFASLLPCEELDSVGRLLEKLQESLGRIDGFGEEVMMLESYLGGASSAPRLEPLSAAAVGGLITVLYAKRWKERSSLRHLLNELRDRKFHDTVERLLNP